MSGAPGAAWNGLKPNVVGLFNVGENGPRPGDRNDTGWSGGVD